MVPRISQKEFKQLADFVYSHYGIHLKKEKQYLVEGRLRSVLEQGGFTSFEAYMEYVQRDTSGAAITTLINKITTNHTYFMRETEHFQFFKSHVLPGLVAQAANRDLRIWSAGCSSGEEPYTLAMLIDEFFGGQKGAWDTTVLATDISTRVLKLAIDGVYHVDKVNTLPAMWKQSYFSRVDSDNMEIVPSLKKEVVFRSFNLMEREFPFKRKFHVIFCRNVMIYFDEKTKAELIRKFYNWTEDGGYLFLGQSESMSRETSSYKYVMPSVYRKV